MSRGLNKPMHIDLSRARTGQGELTEITGKFIRVVDASSAAAKCEIALRGDFNTTYFSMVEMAKITERQGFDGIFVTNEAQQDEWIEIVITDGPEDFDYERPMNNNIGQILTEVEVVSGSTPLNIDAASTDALLANILVMMQNEKDQRKPVVSLDGFTYAQAINATVVPVSAVANVSGCLIARAYCANNGGISRITSGGNILLFAGGGHSDSLEGILIPAGRDITLYSSYTDNYASIYYKLL